MLKRGKKIAASTVIALTVAITGFSGMSARNQDLPIVEVIEEELVVDNGLITADDFIEDDVLLDNEFTTLEDPENGNSDDDDDINKIYAPWTIIVKDTDGVEFFRFDESVEVGTEYRYYPIVFDGYEYVSGENEIGIAEDEHTEIVTIVYYKKTDDFEVKDVVSWTIKYYEEEDYKKNGENATVILENKTQAYKDEEYTLTVFDAEYIEGYEPVSVINGAGIADKDLESAILLKKVEPGDGDKPIDPGDGDKPTNPGDGDKPTNPGDGDKPTNPGDGDKPTNPGDEDKPTDPGNGDKPTNPEGGDKPTSPEDENDPTKPGGKPSGPGDYGEFLPGGEQESNEDGTPPTGIASNAVLYSSVIGSSILALVKLKKKEEY